MGKLSRVQAVALLLTVLFFGLCLGYFLGGRSVGEPWRVTTQRGGGQTERAEPSGEADRRPVSLLEDEVININTASEADLQRLPGIGQAKAGAIAAWREVHGPFSRPEELMEVSGIGEGILGDVRDYITVD